MPPTLVRKEISVSFDAFEELSNALNEAGIKLDNDTEFVVKKDLAIKGPIFYRQVTIRHQILMEVAKVYKTPLEHDFEVSNSSHFIDFLDDVYQYCLTGEKPKKTPPTPQTKPTAKPKAPSGWGDPK